MRQSLGSLGAERAETPGGSGGRPGVGAPTRGQLAVEILEGTPLANGCDLCDRCAAGFLDWLRSGNPDLAAVDGPGGALGDTAVASPMAMS